jgi:hypothetical protein
MVRTIDTIVDAHTIDIQIAAFCACAAASGIMFMRWQRLDHDARQRVWLLYGWFTALMCCGSCIGVFAWAAWMQFLLAYYRSNDITIRHNADAQWETARVSCLL